MGRLKPRFRWAPVALEGRQRPRIDGATVIFRTALRGAIGHGWGHCCLQQGAAGRLWRGLSLGGPTVVSRGVVSDGANVIFRGVTGSLERRHWFQRAAIDLKMGQL